MRLLFFAGLGEKIGRNIEFPYREGMTLKELRQLLLEQYPALEQELRQALLAINQEYAHEESKLNPEDEIAFIPPVSGG